MKKKIQDLKTGERFFYGMWQDFVSYEHFGNTDLIVTCTNGFDDNEFKTIVPFDEDVQISSAVNNPS